VLKDNSPWSVVGHGNICDSLHTFLMIDPNSRPLQNPPQGLHISSAETFGLGFVAEETHKLCHVDVVVVKGTSSSADVEKRSTHCESQSEEESEASDEPIADGECPSATSRVRSSRRVGNMTREELVTADLEYLRRSILANGVRSSYSVTNYDIDGLNWGHCMFTMTTKSQW
jgi:hypothetical protein